MQYTFAFKTVKMKSSFVDCFMLMGTAFSLNPLKKLPGNDRPLMNDTSEITYINISLTVEEVNFINIKTMEIAVILQLHQRWVDPRLGSSIRTQRMAVAGQIWKPRITCTKGLIGDGINKEDTQFWRGFGDEGNVLLSEKFLIKTFCTNYLRRFPFDTQICELKFGSYRFPINEIKLNWHLSPVEFLTGIHLNEFTIMNISTYHEIGIRQTGDFSVIVLQITLQRHFTHYLICTMIPCIILVSLCYLSFWINYNHHTARLIMPLSIILFLIFLYQQSTCTTISVPYLKSMDFFIILSLTFAGFSLFGNCIISYAVSNTNQKFIVEDKNTEINFNKVLLWLDRCIKLIYPILYFCSMLIFVYCFL